MGPTAYTAVISHAHPFLTLTEADRDCAWEILERHLPPEYRLEWDQEGMFDSYVLALLQGGQSEC